MANRIVVALGGNAILTDDPSAQGQMEALRQTSRQLLKLIEAGNEVVITHGNGPQVGNLLLQQMGSDSPKNPALPLDTCVAMTQGSIGYWLEQMLREAAGEAGLTDVDFATLVTQVEVDPNDPAFSKPSKPIGPFLTAAEAKAKEAESDEVYVEDAGRGYRRVVASPKPQSIIEYPAIKNLLDQKIVTISAGGGGVPVKKVGHHFEGVEAVIDKDFSAAILADLVEADQLLILTGVDYVYVNYQKPDEKRLEAVNSEELRQYIAEGQFAPGSMLPKIEAALSFVEKRPEGKAYITSLTHLDEFIEKGAGTTISQ